jgi:hypothetical protein
VDRPTAGQATTATDGTSSPEGAKLPWWRNGKLVATLTAVVAAIVPATTAIQEHYRNRRELALQESKQAHEIRTSYLDRLDKPGARLRTLRFVLATTDDAVLKAWAHAETQQVQGEITAIQEQLAALPPPVASPHPETEEDKAIRLERQRLQDALEASQLRMVDPKSMTRSGATTHAAPCPPPADAK